MQKSASDSKVIVILIAIGNCLLIQRTGYSIHLWINTFQELSSVDRII